jgi:hypothetical protein
MEETPEKALDTDVKDLTSGFEARLEQPLLNEIVEETGPSEPTSEPASETATQPAT